MPVAAAPVSTSMTGVTSTRWIQLVLGLIAMMSISSPQYVWTLFTKSFQDHLHTNLPAIQITFSIVIVLQTWLSPLQGFLIERLGPKLLIGLGAMMSGGLNASLLARWRAWRSALLSAAEPSVIRPLGMAVLRYVTLEPRSGSSQGLSRPH